MFPSPLGVSYFQITKGYVIEVYCRSFRPLSGYLISKLVSTLDVVIWFSRFRPLSGYLISKWLWFFNSGNLGRCVSVPSRGILFPNKNSSNYEDLRCVSVPSRGILFPNKNSSNYEDLRCVSVPSRGILFPNHSITAYRRKNMTNVSVPSRGILFPNKQ